MAQIVTGKGDNQKIQLSSSEVQGIHGPTPSVDRSTHALSHIPIPYEGMVMVGLAPCMRTYNPTIGRHILA